MAHTMDKTIAEARKLVVRLKSFSALADKASKGEIAVSAFLAVSQKATELYSAFQEFEKGTVLDESSGDWNIFCDLLAEVDTLFVLIDGVRIALCESPEPKLETKSEHGSNESLLSNKSIMSNKFLTPSVRLPKISLPSFDGSLKLWSSYYDLFKSLIHDNPSLTAIEKFQYLISTLSKEPLALVKCLPLTSENYAIAFDSLVDRYQNDRVLATFYWNAIFNAPKLHRSDSAQPLRDLLNTLVENVAALERFANLDLWNFSLFNLCLQKLDDSTRKRFETKFANEDFPSFETLRQFLSDQCRALETSTANSSSSSYSSKQFGSVKGRDNINIKKSYNQSSKMATQSFVVTEQFQITCSLCKAAHDISKCDQFLSKTPNERYDFAKQAGLCLICLKSSHRLNYCRSKWSCQTCRGWHHSLLHFVRNVPQGTVQNSSGTSSSSAPIAEISNVVTNLMATKGMVLLSTAQAVILDSSGSPQRIRILLDNGSQASFITERFANKLGLRKSSAVPSVQGLGQLAPRCSGVVNCTIRSLVNENNSFEVEAIVMSEICKMLPSEKFSIDGWDHLSNLSLADETFNVPGPIDMLIGADLCSLIVNGGKIVKNEFLPIALNTAFGWTVTGKIPSHLTSTVSSLQVSLDVSIDQILRKFWEVEEIPKVKVVAPEDEHCEKHYVENTYRNSSGRFVVALPFKGEEPTFFGSREFAVQRFLALERRLVKDPTMYELYREFMKDYLDSGHMEPSLNYVDGYDSYYVPHHCVLKPDSTSTKLRVVFDASAKSGSSNSLNSYLLVGPKLQKDISTILLQFRLHSIAFTADIRQMYRQILITPAHRKYQKILWRSSSDKPLEEYTLNTVTYGVSSSPFLAIRTIQQLAEEEKPNFPLASQILENDMYVDDVVSGSNSLEEALEIQQQLIELLRRGGFELRKWASNNLNMLSSLPVSYLQNSLSFDSDRNTNLKVLGLEWHPSQDQFAYSVVSRQSPCTKRCILAELARIFDPLGFLSPVTILGKHLMQQLWSLKIDWDEVPPPHLVEKWQRYQNDLSQIASLKIPRRVIVEKADYCELHGFADASEKGYAAVIYLRTVYQGFQEVFVSLVCAKAKVAPLQKLSLPRLELCAAKLLVDLMSFVLKSYDGRVHIDEIHAWSDSTVVLSWLSGSPHRWKTFVSNRVSHIQTKLPVLKWHHIRSADNPADCASRGIFASQLVDYPMWCRGPSILWNTESQWSDAFAPPPSGEVLIEEKRIVFLNFISLDNLDHLLNRYSSLSKITRIIAYVCRFVSKVKGSPSEEISLPFTEGQLHKSLLILVKRVQHLVFRSEIEKIEKHLPCSKPIRKLNPFIDKDGILRVGGRLKHSSLSYEAKFPALLPRRHRITELIILETHKRHLHPGPQAMLHLLTQNFWILSARRAIRSCLLGCISCFRVKPSNPEPLMGDLPSTRISQVKPFSIVGVDYGGPFLITQSRRRGSRYDKAYLCLFVCFATKAVHLELASSLSTDAFLAALRRFISRRGRVESIFPGSDDIIRVATVRTAKGLFKRSVRKLCPLPILPDQGK